MAALKALRLAVISSSLYSSGTRLLKSNHADSDNLEHWNSMGWTTVDHNLNAIAFSCGQVEHLGSCLEGPATG